MYSDRNQQLIVSSTKHQFRESEFSNIFLFKTRVCFQPIVGKMEKYLPTLSAFKIVSASQETAAALAQTEEPGKREQTNEYAGASDSHLGHDAEGLERRHDCQSSIGAVNGRLQRLESDASLPINSDDFQPIADDLINRNQHTNSLISQLENEITLLKSANRKLEQALNQANTQVFNDAKQARRIKCVRKRDRGWGAAPSTWKDTK